MIVRIFMTAMDPDDIEEAKTLFRDAVRPAFEAFEGCRGIEMTIGIDEHSADLVDVASISRWDSLESIRRATGTVEYEDALRDIRKLFQQAPLVRHLELVD